MLVVTFPHLLVGTNILLVCVSLPLPSVDCRAGTVGVRSTWPSGVLTPEDALFTSEEEPQESELALPFPFI